MDVRNADRYVTEARRVCYRTLEFRACLQISQLHAVLPGPPPSISGVGLISTTNFWVSSDPSATYLKANPDSVIIDELPQAPQRPSAAIIHDVCWTLLLARLAGEDTAKTYQPNRVAECLRVLLSCFPCDSKGDLLTRFGYGGALASRNNFDLAGEYLFLLVSPVQDITKFVTASQSMAVDLPQSTKAIIKPAGGMHAARDPFGCFPVEILETIFIMLPSADFCSLRLASRAAAAISSPASLSRPFWKSRFAPGREMDYFLAGQRHVVSGMDLDWYKLYRFLQECRNGGLANKRRIWKVFHHLCVSLIPLMEYWTTTTPETPLPVEIPLPEGYRNGAFVQSHVAHLDPDQHVIFPGNSPVRLSLSFINFNCRNYLSGIRLQGYKGQGDVQALSSSQVGLIIPPSEEHLDLGPGEVIQSVRVYSLEDGIVGVEFHIDTCSNGQEVRLLGGSVASNPGAAVGELVPDVSWCIRGFSFAVNVWAHILPSSSRPMPTR